eukprot:TRINITY_DN18661_c0_g2_i1.p1 TRINITY_DN18661_c0_g2~~TRINITY_DN18661_c0_g2_i1.p1  ORF type:complete len:763 (-),score=55.53 TRINITY_DN18661_c0_g2_i1:73-2217(-)
MRPLARPRPRLLLSTCATLLASLSHTTDVRRDSVEAAIPASGSADWPTHDYGGLQDEEDAGFRSGRRLKRTSITDLRVGEAVVSEDARFGRLRDMFEVPADFLSGERVDMSKVERAEGGAHAQLVTSRDAMYVVKIASEHDWHSLHELLDDYVRFMGQHPGSLLPRFFSAFKAFDARWVVMFNWVRPAVSGHHRLYDLKGTSCSTTPSDRLVRVDLSHKRVPTLKDLNFVQNEVVLHVSQAGQKHLLAQLEIDTMFLQQHQLMDYSLILSVSRVGVCDADVLQKVCYQNKSLAKAAFKAPFQTRNGYLAGVQDDQSMMHIYSLGLIDILQRFDWMKQAASGIKATRCGSEERDTVDPSTYQKRFYRYFAGRIIADSRELTKFDCMLAADEDSGQCSVLRVNGKELVDDMNPLDADLDEREKIGWPTSVVVGLSMALFGSTILLVCTMCCCVNDQLRRFFDGDLKTRSNVRAVAVRGAQDDRGLTNRARNVSGGDASGIELVDARAARPDVIEEPPSESTLEEDMGAVDRLFLPLSRQLSDIYEASELESTPMSQRFSPVTPRSPFIPTTPEVDEERIYPQVDEERVYPQVQRWGLNASGQQATQEVSPSSTWSRDLSVNPAVLTSAPPPAHWGSQASMYSSVHAAPASAPVGGSLSGWGSCASLPSSSPSSASGGYWTSGTINLARGHYAPQAQRAGSSQAVREAHQDLTSRWR